MKLLPNVVLSILALLVFTTSANAQFWSLSGTMDVLQAGTNGGFGAGTGNGTGSISGFYNSASNELDYLISWQDLTSTATNAHFHLGAPGVAGSGIQLAIPAPFTSPKVGDNIVLTNTQEGNLLAGNWYVNIHTQNFSGGEIRGQVNVTAIPEPGSFAVLCAIAAGAGVKRRRR